MSPSAHRRLLSFVTVLRFRRVFEPREDSPACPPRQLDVARPSVAGFARAVVPLGLALVAATGCSAPRPGATTRLALHFGIADVSSERSIESGLAAKLPPGTPEASVVAFLASSGVGKDGLSSVHPAGEDRVIVVRIEFDPESIGFVKESYGISFRLDDRRTLESIGVKRWLTGP